MTKNSMMVISPYWSQGTWVFDDPAVGLVREPFVAGVPAIIDHIVKAIPDARAAGFRLTFSGSPFPGHQHALDLLRAESGGNWYRLTNPPKEGWLCPALFHYFDEAPRQLFVRVDPKGE